MQPLLKTLRRGTTQIFEHPQLWLTIVVAIAIVGSFSYMANRFISIARDAQDRLVNVRVGSLQDAFVPLASAFIREPARLQSYMQGIVRNNPTISEFDIIEKTNDTWVITNSIDERRVGTSLIGKDFFISLATADPSNSFTIEEVDGSTRFFRTARAITDASSSVIAVALTRQSLSEADRSIAASIQTSVGVLVAILLLLMFLFFHHARIIDYTALYRRLKEVDQLKDDFISMASHELRTPLTVIRGYIAELKERHVEEGTEVGGMIDKIDHSAESLNMLVTDMLDVARIEQGRISLQMQNMDPRALLEEICASFQPGAKHKSLALSYASEGPGVIFADPDRLRQVLTNLIGNAIKYSDKGAIQVISKRELQTFTIRVSDTGIGMSADDISHLFGKFNRAAGDRVKSEVGTGLGLWITKQLVEAMGGKISVESIQGVGSHFIVTFPLVENRA